MSESKAVVWTNVVTPAGFVVSITSRDGGEVEESYQNIITFLADHPHLTPFVQYNNQYRDTSSVVEEAQRLGGEVTEDKVTGQYLGLLNFQPKSSDLKPGQTYELTVDEYVANAKEIVFWKAGNQYPSHTHKLTSVGKKRMEELFGDTWDEFFIDSNEKEAMAGGELIIKVQGSDKLTNQGNPYKNLIGIRRPE